MQAMRGERAVIRVGVRRSDEPWVSLPAGHRFRERAPSMHPCRVARGHIIAAEKERPVPGANRVTIWEKSRQQRGEESARVKTCPKA